LEKEKKKIILKFFTNLEEFISKCNFYQLESVASGDLRQMSEYPISSQSNIIPAF
jgi:hypothetical protein